MMRYCWRRIFVRDIYTNDYYPFGMLMRGRTYSAQSTYRYGFNEKEMDNEASGQGNLYDYSFRIYNARLGRFLSIDPVTNLYPYYTPYQFAGNMPIAAIDLDGLEQYVVVYYKDIHNTTTKIMIRVVYDNKGTIQNQRIHKVGSTSHVAKGNVLVFEIKKAQNGKETMSIVENRNIAGGKLTEQELAIFNKNKRLEQENDTERDALVYQTDNPKKVIYTSEYFTNANTKTYKALFGIAQPDEKPNTGPPQQPEAIQKQPSLPNVSFFTRDGYSVVKDDKYFENMNTIVKWLKDNPGYNLKINLCGLAGKETNAKSWDATLTWLLFSKNVTYADRVNNMTREMKEYLKKNGLDHRVNIEKGTLNSKINTYELYKH